MLVQFIYTALVLIMCPVAVPTDSVGTSDATGKISAGKDRIPPEVAIDVADYPHHVYSRFYDIETDEEFAATPVDKPNRLYDVLNLYDRDIIRLSGRLYFDAAYVYQAENPAQSDEDAIGKVTSREFGTLVRSARLRAEGAITAKARWRAEMEVIDRLFTIRGFFFQYDYRPNIQFLFGNIIKEPMGIERMSPLGWYPFLELAPSVGTFMPDRNLSFRVEYNRQRLNILASVLSGAESFYDSASRSGFAFAGRVSYAPVVTDRHFIHIGGHSAYRRNALETAPTNGIREFESLIMATRSGSRAAGNPVIGVLPIEHVESINRHGAEIASGYGRLYTQAEWTWVRLNRNFDHAALNLGGYYLQAGYFLTNDRRPYRPSKGNFGPVAPRNPFISVRGTGAIEVAVRYSDTNTNNRDYSGGDIRQLALALNWYLDHDTRLMLNYVVHNSERLDGSTHNGNVLTVRVTFEF